MLEDLLEPYNMISQEQIIQLLREVMDPEIPTISLYDLGVVSEIQVDSQDNIYIQLTPTFSGCPAMKVMEENVYTQLKTLTKGQVKVETTFDKQWNSDMITDYGREMLLKHRLAPPPKHQGYLELEVLSDVACPQCGSRNTELRSPFGPTLCRSLHYCNHCKQGFEQFKPVT